MRSVKCRYCRWFPQVNGEGKAFLPKSIEVISDASGVRIEIRKFKIQDEAVL